MKFHNFLAMFLKPYLHLRSGGKFTVNRGNSLEFLILNLFGIWCLEFILS